MPTTQALTDCRSVHVDGGATMWPIAEFCQAWALRFTLSRHGVSSEMIGWSIRLPDFQYGVD